MSVVLPSERMDHDPGGRALQSDMLLDVSDDLKTPSTVALRDLLTVRISDAGLDCQSGARPRWGARCGT